MNGKQLKRLKKLGINPTSEIKRMYQQLDHKDKGNFFATLERMQIEGIINQALDQLEQKGTENAV